MFALFLPVDCCRLFLEYPHTVETGTSTDAVGNGGVCGVETVWVQDGLGGSPQLLASNDLNLHASMAADPKPSEAAAANRIAMHPVTGTFADPADEERLLYEVQRRGHPIDDDRRSLFAGRMTEPIPRDAPRSEYDPDIEAAAAVATPIAKHPVTGAFADPTHERAFAAYFFRLCFGWHVVLMALFVFTPAWDAITEFSSTEPMSWLLLAFWIFLGLLGLMSRVRIHQWDDTARAQRLGARIWTALTALSIAGDCVGLTFFKPATCEAAALLCDGISSGLWMVWTVLLTGSHGMSFTHKFGLTCALMFEPFLLISACGLRWAPYSGLVCASMAVFGMAHLAEMHVRHKQRQEAQMNAEAEESLRRLEERNEQLRAEKERLMYDLQRRGNPLDDVFARTAIRRGLLAARSCHSSHTSSTGCPGPSDSLPASLPPGPPSSDSSGSVVAPVGSAQGSQTVSLCWGEVDRPESGTAEANYEGELERVVAEVARKARGQQLPARYIMMGVL